MRKVCVVVAATALMGVVSSWAQTTNILSKQDLVIKAKLSPSGTAVTGQSLSGNTNVISHLELQVINGTTTNQEQWIGQVVGGNITLLMQQMRMVDLTPASTKGDKFVTVFVADGQVGTSSNAVLLVSGTSKQTVKSGVTNETVSAKLTGVWVDGTESGTGQAISGSLSSAK